jgi:hypothetical protein
MEIQELQKVLKMHAYYQSCSYEYAWEKYIHQDIKNKYSFEEVMKNI